nr:hypothetical protein [Tanacetum cinerariifolium]
PADHDDEEDKEEPSRDDADEEDEEQDEDDDDEEEEHSASADSIPPPPALCVTARISFRPQPPTLSFTKEDAERQTEIFHRVEALVNDSQYVSLEKSNKNVIGLRISTSYQSMSV